MPNVASVMPPIMVATLYECVIGSAMTIKPVITSAYAMFIIFLIDIFLLSAKFSWLANKNANDIGMKDSPMARSRH